jgi:hypothetical protein
MDITKAKVTALPDLSGEYRIHDYMSQELGEFAKAGSHEHTVKLSYLIKGMNFLSFVDRRNLPEREDLFETELEIDIEGKTYSRKFELVKPLRKVPIYELRIDLPEFAWFFRATFFPIYYEQELHYCFVYPFEKYPGHPDPTNDYRDLTYKVLEEVRKNPIPFFKEG